MFRRATVLFSRGFIPRLDFENVSDVPEQGSLTRFTAEARNVRLAVTPQLGPRKQDPDDNEPQFDVVRRCLTTLSLHEVAMCIAVIDKVVPEFKVSADFRNLAFTRHGDNFTIEGSLTRNDTGATLPIKLTVHGGQLVGLKHFFESSLIQGFGFAQYLQGRRRPVATRRPLGRRLAARGGSRPRRGDRLPPPRGDRRPDNRRSYDDRRVDTRRDRQYQPPRLAARYQPRDNYDRDRRSQYQRRDDYYQPRDRAPRRDRDYRDNRRDDF